MAERKLSKFDGKKRMWLKVGKKFSGLLIVLFLIFRFLIGVSWVSGQSMYPTYDNGDPVVYFRLVKDYARGDVVSVKMPSGEYYIKRVIAVGGDTVDIIDGVVYVNGEPETGDYVNGRTESQPGKVTYPLEIPAGRIFVIGDNREVSIDSRTFGALSASQTRGRILFGTNG